VLEQPRAELDVDPIGGVKVLSFNSTIPGKGSFASPSHVAVTALAF
jgi:hypothetical protein